MAKYNFILKKTKQKTNKTHSTFPLKRIKPQKHIHLFRAACNTIYFKQKLPKSWFIILLLVLLRSLCAIVFPETTYLCIHTSISEPLFLVHDKYCAPRSSLLSVPLCTTAVFHLLFPLYHNLNLGPQIY